MDEKPMEERLYERLNLPIKINYEISTRPHAIKKVASKNISGGGVCLSLLEKLLPDTKLKMNISIPKETSRQRSRLPSGEAESAKSEDYELEGRVVWARMVEVSREGALSTYYDTGIKFLETDPVIIGKIIAYFHGREL